jgi:hypothetical protein
VLVAEEGSAWAVSSVPPVVRDLPVTEAEPVGQAHLGGATIGGGPGTAGRSELRTGTTVGRKETPVARVVCFHPRGRIRVNRPGIHGGPFYDQRLEFMA